MDFEAKIGLETHIELLTKTKMFCSCKNIFGADVNTCCCPVCTAQPGAMPRLNEEAVRLAVTAGRALGCSVSKKVYMARKNYLYPDLPKAYQISQSTRPLCFDGALTLPSGRKIGIERVHIEEDAGKLKHTEEGLLIDYNRAGVPLIEIVTKPDFKTGDEVKAYLELLAMMMKKLGISDCKMEEGSLRCDINISLIDEYKNYERTEIKNVNSFTYAKKAVDFEICRQTKIIASGNLPERETRRFDAARAETVLMRKKETGGDYRYFDDPDIPPVKVSEKWIVEADSAARHTADKAVIGITEMGLSYEEAMNIVKYDEVYTYFIALAKETNDASFAKKLVYSYVFAAYSEEERNKKIIPDADEAARVYKMFCEGKIDKSFQKKIFTEMYEKRKSFGELFDLADFSPIPESDIINTAKAAVEKQEKAVNDYMAGNEKAVFPLIGSVMKALNGRADAKKVREILDKIIFK